MKITSIFFILSAVIAVTQAAAVPVPLQANDVPGYVKAIDTSSLTSSGSSIDKIPIFARSIEDKHRHHHPTRDDHSHKIPIVPKLTHKLVVALAGGAPPPSKGLLDGLLG